MTRVPVRATAACFLMAIACAAVAPAQTDVIVGDLTTPMNLGNVGGVYAYAIGTTSCNIGNQVLVWIAGTNQHPVIAQNIYRIKDGRFEQVGMSWVKHGFTALQQTVCFSDCQAYPNGTALGIHCSDPYSASNNAQQSRLGPRSEVNATTGFFPYPFTSPTIPTTTGRRLQMLGTDLDPTQNLGAIYLAEGQYVHPEDAAAGNGLNNASYRQCQFAAGSFNMSYIGNTVREKPAILGWKDMDPNVSVTTIDVPNDGRFHVALKTKPVGSLTRYDYAIHNLNSDRSLRGVQFAMPAGATVSGLYFHDIDYHSNEFLDSSDWVSSWSGGNVTFECAQTFAQNSNANALRWGTVYTFSFLSDAPPTAMNLELFKPGTPTSISVGPFFRMDIGTTGAGAGDLNLGVDGIPSSTIEGYCLFSFYAPTPFGAGALLGLYPDQITMLSLTQVAFPGNFLHWTWPVAAPLFPASDLALPPGSLTFAAGTRVDGVCIAFGAGFSYLGATPPIRATF